jgi:D-alanyl-D-alanine carboxypeptidase/D-alanyl-D-alanine-endopeptidase (penicillin-binding protein 4)
MSMSTNPAAAVGTTTTPTSAPAAPTVPPTAPATPVLSARRLPGLLAAHKADAQLQAAIQPILAQVTPTTCLTVRAAGRPIASSNGRLAVMPASTEKLLTATAVLDHLGANGIVTTAAVSASAPSGGVVDGDLFVVGAGDPLLATTGYLSTFDEPSAPYNDYATLADDIKAAGITQIRGNVVGDESRFDDQRYLPSWPRRYIAQSEVGPLGALMVNDGFTGLSTTPDVPASVRRPGDPAPLAAETLISLLRSRGVRVDGNPTTGTAPSGAATVAKLDSKPMSINVQEMLKRSDNTTAEVLAKDLGALAGSPGTTAGGAQVVQDTLTNLGLPTEGSVTIDGSGLDPGNRVTCDLLVAALDHQGAHSAVADDLPVAGKSGTLRKRMRGTAAEGKIRAKTGTLNDVGALAGFATAASGEDLTFAFVINGALPSSQALGDQLGVALARYGVGVALAQISPTPPAS